MNHTKIQKYFKKKAADGTVSKIAVATLLLFNLAYFFSLSISQAGKKVDFNFLKDVADPRTYFYIIASSIISAVLILSFIFHKVKTKRLSCSGDQDLFNKTKELLLSDSKKDKMKKVTINLDHNGLMIMPDKNVIEIPVVQGSTENEKLKGINKLFEEVTFTTPSFWSSKNKSIYPEVIGSEEVWNTIEGIKRSKVFFFKKTDFEKYYNKSNPDNVRYQHDTMYLSNGEIQKSADKNFEFTDLYNINSIKFHYADCSSTEVKLKLKGEQSVDMNKYSELLDYVNANRSHPLSSIKEPQIAFIPAIAGKKPIFSGEVL
ncbi:hypothetical protein [Candidatus Mesenet endosymbiont of Agriotes lineatus]|uniref:hypothetical protein n=1 Tax=Candidatus Mesenet endosymbiont of Agriotes lineatus TaxID=3077948 RepID=UPI0030CDEC81